MFLPIGRSIILQGGSGVVERPFLADLLATLVAGREDRSRNRLGFLRSFRPSSFALSLGLIVYALMTEYVERAEEKYSQYLLASFSASSRAIHRAQTRDRYFHCLVRRVNIFCRISE